MLTPGRCRWVPFELRHTTCDFRSRFIDAIMRILFLSYESGDCSIEYYFAARYMFTRITFTLTIAEYFRRKENLAWLLTFITEGIFKLARIMPLEVAQMGWFLYITIDAFLIYWWVIIFSAAWCYIHSYHAQLAALISNTHWVLSY